MIYTLRPGDTLRAIATAQTISSEYGPAIAEFNGIFEDDGVTPFADNKPLPYDILESLTIPDNWLLGTDPGADRFGLWIFGIAAAVLIFGPALGARRR